MSPPKIVILLLNWNGRADTLACLESLQHLSYSQKEVIVIDNGSTDGSVEAIEQRFPQHLLVQNKVNLGFAEGNNVGIHIALQRGAEYILLLNNDTLVAQDLLERFIEIFALYPKAGVLGAKIFLFDPPDTLDHLGGMWDKKTGTFTLVGLREKYPIKESPEELDYVCGTAFMIKRQVIETIGLLEKRFFLIWEESDFCFRAKREGFTILTCPQAHIWHKVSASFVGGKPHSTYFWWRNRLLWIERNCSFRERLSLYVRILIPDILHMLKIRALKTLQLWVVKRFKSIEVIEKKEFNLLKNKAALCGVKDYLCRKFGNGPAWLYTKRP